MNLKLLNRRDLTITTSWQINIANEEQKLKNLVLKENIFAKSPLYTYN